MTTTIGGLGASTVALGLTLSGALLFIGIGIIQWARKLMADHEIVEMRHPAASSDADREETLAALQHRPRGVRHRPPAAGPQLACSARSACSRCPVPIVLLRDLGPLPGDALYSTIWAPGMRVVRDVTGTPIRPADIEFGDLVNGEPAAIFETDEEGEPLVEGVELQVAKSKGAVILVRMEPDDITPGPGPRGLERRRDPLLLQDLHPRRAARSRSTSGPPTTCCARATSRPSTSPTRPGWSSARQRAHCPSCPWR